MQAVYHFVRLVLPERWVTHAENLLSEMETSGWLTEGNDPVNLTVYVSSRGDAIRARASLSAALAAAGLRSAEFSCEAGNTPAEDWESQWRSTLYPLRIGRRWLVRPSWQSSEPFDHRVTLVIDPKMAFGTGTHPTTQLCLLEMEGMEIAGASVLDVGSGTGILAMAAAKEGASEVTAVEIDPDAVACAAENLELNGLVANARLITGTLDDVPKAQADIIVANIQFEPLTAIAGDLRRRIQPEGIAVFSGILQAEAERFVAELARTGWRVRRIRRGYDPTTNDAWMSFTANPA